MTSLTQIKRERVEALDLIDLAAELTRMQESKRDYVADTRRVGFFTEGTDSFVTIDGVDDEQFRLRDLAHTQVATKLGIPKAYWDRMRKEAPGLLDTNATTWMNTKPERRLFRMLDGEMRAYLSDRYQRRDNFDLMERAILPALQDVEGLTFHVSSLTPERMYVREILPALEAEVKVGQIVQAGVQIRNSEVGRGALEVSRFIWKLDCLNGMVSQLGRMRAYHVGKQIDENVLAFAQDTLAADDKAFFLKTRDAIKQAITEDGFMEVVAGMREAAGGEKIADPVKATERLAQSSDLSDVETGSILQSLAAGGDLSRWGLLNAVTDAAKSAPTFERQEEMERIGGGLLEISEREWVKIAA